jgi:hypothetical protein
MWAAVLRAPLAELRAPFRELAELLERALDVRADPFADRVAPLLDDLDCARLAALEVVRVVLALLRVVRAFVAWVRFLAAPLEAEPVREAGFDAAALAERLVLLLPVPARDRFVVAMSPPKYVTPGSCDQYPPPNASNLGACTQAKRGRTEIRQRLKGGSDARNRSRHQDRRAPERGVW